MNYFVLLFLPFLVFANNTFEESLIKYIHQNKLYNSETWLSLNYYNIKPMKSEIISSKYFLSPYGEESPKHELFKTVKMLFSKNVKKCKYVDRYEFLEQSMPNKFSANKIANLAKCDEFEDFYNRYKYADLYYGYFLPGTKSEEEYGHSMIILQVKKNNDLKNLYLSYGVDENLYKEDWGITQKFKGIFGGYTARYNVYRNSDVQNKYIGRSLSKTKLKLSNEQKRMLLAILYLVYYNKRDIEFDYYFLSKNCGYQINNILEIIYNTRYYFNRESFYIFEPLDVKTVHLRYCDTERCVENF